MIRLRRGALLAIKLAVSATLLLLALRAVGSADVAGRLRTVDASLALCAAAIQAATVLLMAIRWHILSLGLLTLGQSIRYTYIGLFYGAVLPGAISGDVAKGAAVAWRDRSTRTAVLPVSILADRLSGLAVLVLFFAVACVWLTQNPPGDNPELARMGALGLAISIPLLFTPILLTPAGQRLVRRAVGARLPLALGRALAGSFGIFDLYRGRARLWGFTLLTSLAIQAGNVAFYIVVLRAMGFAPPLHTVVLLYSALAVLVMIPISVSGFGVREWFALAYFPAIGLPADAGVAFSLMCVALTWLLAGIGVALQLLDLLPGRRPGVRRLAS